MSIAVGTDARTRASNAFFAAEADRIARLCRDMAARFSAGGRLLAFGRTPAAQSDARHVAVEFVHPVIVGKRALPALAVVGDGIEAQARLLVEPGDVVITFDAPEVERLARERGAMTVTWDAPDADPLIAQEVSETFYHLLWELVHVFLDHGATGERSGAGAASFLYPFLDDAAGDEEALVADARASVLAKAEEIAALREQTLAENAEVIAAAAEVLRSRFAAGGRLLALGNGGSATDAMDVVADLHTNGHPALDLTQDPAILTAIANDVGVENIFARQVIAHGRPEDVLLAISTSGGSANVIAALAEGRRRGLHTIAMVGYDGGRILSEQLADHVVVTRSDHIPRIQEAQASAYHVLVGLVG